MEIEELDADEADVVVERSPKPGGPLGEKNWKDDAEDPPGKLSLVAVEETDASSEQSEIVS